MIFEHVQLPSSRNYRQRQIAWDPQATQLTTSNIDPQLTQSTPYASEQCLLKENTH